MNIWIYWMYFGTGREFQYTIQCTYKEFAKKKKRKRFREEFSYIRMPVAIFLLLRAPHHREPLYCAAFFKSYVKAPRACLHNRASNEPTLAPLRSRIYTRTHAAAAATLSPWIDYYPSFYSCFVDFFIRKLNWIIHKKLLKALELLCC